MSARPGLQPERTAIAWTRTGLALLVNGLLLMRAGVQSGPRGASFFLLLFGAALLIGYAVLFFSSSRQQRVLAAGRPPLRRYQALLLAALTSVVGLGVSVIWIASDWLHA